MSSYLGARMRLLRQAHGHRVEGGPSRGVGRTDEAPRVHPPRWAATGHAYLSAMARQSAGPAGITSTCRQRCSEVAAVLPWGPRQRALQEHAVFDARRVGQMGNWPRR
jgi:hypothetical protein